MFYICTNKIKQLEIMTHGYEIKTINDGTLFYVCDEYSMYGNYYKTLKGAQKKLEEVLRCAGKL